MSLNSTKRNYWLRLSNEFFEDAVVKKLRKMAGGDTYVCIYLKMQLKSINSDGIIYFEGIENTLEKELALKLDEDEDNVRATLLFLNGYGLLEKITRKEFLLTKVPACIGKESTSAERVRRHRERKKIENTKSLNLGLQDTKALHCNTDVTECNADVTSCNANVIEVEMLHCNTDVTECNKNVTAQNLEIKSLNLGLQDTKALHCNADVTECNADVTSCNANVTEVEMLHCNTDVTECNKNVTAQNLEIKSLNLGLQDTKALHCNKNVTLEREKEKDIEKELQQQHGNKFKQEKSGGGKDLSFLLEKWLEIKSQNKKNPSAYKASLKNKFEKDKKSVKEEFADWLNSYKTTNQKEQIEKRLQSYKNRKIVTKQGNLKIMAIELLENFQVKLFFESGNYSIVESLEALELIQTIEETL